MSSAPNWYDDAHIHYWGSSLGDNYVVLTNVYGSIYHADIPDSGVSGWRVCRYVSGNRYNDCDWITDTSKNKYTVNSSGNGGTAAAVIGVINGGYIYYDNSVQNWSGTIQFVIGHSTYSRTYTMTQLTGTKLWYVNLSSQTYHEWADATYYAVICSASKVADGSWGSSSLSSKGTSGYSAAYTSAYSLNSGSTYLIKQTSSGNNKAMTINYYSGYSAIPTNTMTASVRTKVAGGSYGTSYNSPTSVTMVTRQLTNNGTSSAGASQTATVTTSAKTATKADVTTGEVNFSYTALADNAAWTFDGWGTSSSAVSSTASTYQIAAGSAASKTATTIYAFFTRKPVLTVTKDANGDSASGTATNNAKTTWNITASPNSGYRFKNWTTTSGTVTFGDNTAASTTATISADATIQANFEAIPAGEVTVNAGTGGQVSKTSGSGWASSVTFSDITTAQTLNIYAKANDHYEFSTWTKVSGDGSIGTNATSGTYNITANGSAVVRADFLEKKHNVTVQYKCGSTTIKTATTTSNVGEVTTSSVSAPAISGYNFSNWTVESGVTATTSTTATPVSIKTNSTGTYTITANYTEDLNSTWNVVGDNTGPFLGWTASATTMMMKKTGYSTSNDVYWTATVTPAQAAPTETQWEFKIYNTAAVGDAQWYGWGTGSDNYYNLKREYNSITLSNGTNNVRFKPYLAGEYEFHFNTSTKVLTVTWPVINQLRISSATPTDATNTGNYDLSAPVSNVRSVTRSLEANTTYTFKIVYNSDWYGYNSGTFARNSSTSSNSLATSTAGGDMTLTTDYAGSYTFKFNQTNHALSVDFPAAYKITYSKGTVNGSTGSCSAVDLDNGSSAVTSNSTWVKSGNRVKLTAPAAKEGYSYNGWFDNNAGTGTAITNNANCTITVSSALSRYACYTENNYTVTVNAGAGGTVASASVTGHKDTKVTLPTATPNAGYYFTGWTTTAGTLTNASSASAAQINNLTAAATVTANFAPRWRLVGSMNSWNDATNPLLSYTTAGGKNYVSVTVGLNANTRYSFKVKDMTNGNMYKPTLTNTEITYTNKDAREMNNTEGGDPNQTIMTAGKGSYSFTWNITDKAIVVSYPASCTVTFGKGTGGKTITATGDVSGTITSGQYVTRGEDVTFTQTPATGYTFKGWYTTADGNTTVTGMSTSDNVLDNIADNATVYAQYNPSTYSVRFDNNGGSGATPSPITVTYNATYGTLPDGPTPPGADAFVGWYTLASGGTKVTPTTTVTTAANHTLYAHFESTYVVTIKYLCGTTVLRAQTSTSASASSVTANISAPDILGYRFVNWTGDNATFGDATSAATTVNVTAATSITANYEVVPMVYFKNNLEWDNVYVSFDNTWKTVDGKEVPSNKGKPYYKMSQLGTSDIYYCVIPSTYVDNNYENWAYNIAFDNTNYGETAETATHTGSWDEFYGGKFTGRGDFDPNATMFIPYDGDTETRNSGTFYKTGCWIQYNTNYSDYKVEVWNSVNGNSGEQLQSIQLTADVAGSFEFKATVWLGYSATAVGMKLYKDKLKNPNEIWYTNVNDEEHTITSETTTLPWSFEGTGNNNDESWQRCRILPEVSGNYIFTVSFATGRPMVNIEYPVTVGDFRLVYKDHATWNNAHDASWSQVSPVFKHAANRVDTASFFVSYGSSPTVELQECTNIVGAVQTWTKQSDVSLSSVTKKGVYNFKVTQNASGTAATAVYAGAYEGGYYVRTDASDGGWNNYKTSANSMTYSEYSLTHGGSSGPYSYYFMRHVNAGQNIKFIVANDYSLCLTDTLVDDTYAHEWIEAEANVRFTYNHETNEIHRAYISGSSIISDRFLVLEGDAKLYDANGNPLTGSTQVSGLEAYEMNFVDDQNWVYETTVQANPLARVKLTANFNNQTQYFYGAKGARTPETTHQLIGGTGSDKYKMRVVYDFKTNRLVSAWLPTDAAVTTEFDLDADIMIIRYHQGDAQQITFSGEGGKLKDVYTVYGAMQFNKYRLNNQSEAAGHASLGLTVYERDLFFISFPFDVKLNDVFGFGSYGKHWIIEYYDGKGRAQNGFWADSPTNWKFVTKAMKDDYVLKANEGYVLALDLDELKPESSVWDYGVENVYLYFPSSATLGTIQATSRTLTIDQVGYECTINRGTPDGDRRIKDSYWHLLGVPSFANASHETSSTWSGTVPNPASWTTSAPFVYTWSPTTNHFTAEKSSSFSFKPMYSYLTQYAQTSITWTSVNTTPPSVAARRANETVTNCDFQLNLQKDGEELDHTFISLRDEDEVTTEFDFSYDLCKMLYGAFTTANNIYTFAGKEPVAGNCLPITEEITILPVGVQVATDGDYTFSMPDGTNGVGVTFVDGLTGEQTNLALTDYTVTLEKGTYDGRFTLEISPIQQITTSVESVNSANGDGSLNGVSKKLIDGVLYIVKDGKVFDARGARVK